MNKIYLLTALALTAQGFAAANNSSNSNKKNQNAFFAQGDQGLDSNKSPAAYNAPARIQLQDAWDIAIDGSFIYWHASQDNMDIGESTTFGDTTTTTTIATQKFSYKPGFKVGMSFNIGHDDWVFGAEYTWLHETTTSTFQTSSPGSFWEIDDWFHGAFPVTDDTLSTSWKLKFNLIEGYATRPFYQGKYLTISPRSGIRALWIDQKLDIASGDASSNTQSKNWMIGPSAGMDMHWLCGCGFRIESIADASLLYTRFTKVSLQDSRFIGDSEQASLKNLNRATPMFDMGLGLGWGTYFASNGAHFDIAARYDLMYLWDQNALRNLVGESFNAGRPNGNLALQGLTVTVRFDF